MNLPPLPRPDRSNLLKWAREVTSYFESLATQITSPQVIQLEHKKDTAKAIADGMLMWDSENSVPVVSFNGQWHSLPLGAVVTGGIEDKT